jgi:hypothetical protein
MSVATISLWEAITDVADVPVPNATVTLAFGYNGATTADGLLQPSVRRLQTDSTGKVTFPKVIPNDLISPANTVYVITTPFSTYEVAPQSGNGSSQQSTAANVIVNAPLALAPYTGLSSLTVSGPITATGLVTAMGNESIYGDLILGGGGPGSRILSSQDNLPGVGSGGAGVSALSLGAGSTNMAGQVLATLIGIAPGVVIGVVAFDDGPLASAPKFVYVSLAGPTAGVAAPPVLGADTYTTSGFTIRGIGPTTVTSQNYIINYWCIF